MDDIEVWVKIILTLLAGGFAGWLMLKKKIPAGILVGSILGVSILNVGFSAAAMPYNAKVLAQILTGAFLGCGITRQDIAHLPQVSKPFFVVMGTFLVLNLGVGFVIWKTTPLDLMTSLLCALPGGISDTPLIAMDMGADAPKVAVLQFVRLVFGIAALPGLIVMFDRGSSNEPSKDEPAKVVTRSALSAGHNGGWGSLFLTLAVAAAGGLFGRWLKVAAGALVFSMIFSLLFKFAYPKAHMPLRLRQFAQLVSGCCIGCSFTRADIFELRYLVWPALLLMVGYLVNCVLVGKLMHRMFGLSLREGMLSASPAGATEMAFIAADMGVDSPNLIVLQICRLIVAMAVFPQIFTLILHLLGLS